MKAIRPCSVAILLASIVPTGAFAHGEPALRIEGVRVTESTRSAVFVARLSAPSSRAVTVAYRTTEGSALAGRDFAAQNGRIRFSPGATVRTVAIRIHDDRREERDERFAVHLFDARGATITRGRAGGLILDNDPESRLRGDWSGTTSQGHDISFSVDDDGMIHSLRVTYTVEGFRCESERLVLFGAQIRIRNDRFTGSHDDDQDSVEIRGTFSSRTRVAGVVEASYSSAHEGPCEASTNPTWSAARG